MTFTWARQDRKIGVKRGGFARPAVVLLLPLAVLLSACDDSEQGRILRYEKGTYLGEKHTPLNDDRVEQLRQRTLRQGG